VRAGRRWFVDTSGRRRRVAPCMRGGTRVIAVGGGGVTACGCWVVNASGRGGRGHVTACRHGGRRWVVVVASCGHGRGRVAMCVRTDTGVITVIVDAGDGMVAVDEWQ